MTRLDGQFLRNIGVIAHIDAGKTTLTERMLFETGAVRFCGEVQEGTTVSDFLLQERERGISILSAAISTNWKNCQLNIVDTPGHVDFTSEVERALRVMDGVVAVICGVHGVQAQTETVWRRAERYKLPALAFVNKLDREGADFERCLREIPGRLGICAVPLQMPLYRQQHLVGVLDVLNNEPEWLCGQDELDDLEIIQAEEYKEQLIEKLAEQDDEILFCYLAGNSPEPKRLADSLKKAVAKRTVVPVFCGSASMGCGVRQLLDGICDFLPAPGLEDKCEEPCCLVFKVEKECWLGDYAAARIYGMPITKGQILKNHSNGCDFRVEKVFRLKAEDVVEIDVAGFGDIVGLAGNVSEIMTGDVLCAAEAKSVPPGMRFPEPVVCVAVEGIREEDRSRLPGILKRASENDPTVRTRFDDTEGVWLISGMGELHLEILVERFRTEFGLQLRIGKPKVTYMVTAGSVAKVHSSFVKQLTPTRAVGAEIILGLEPLPRGGGLELNLDRIVEKVDSKILSAIRIGLNEGVESGYRSGIPLTDTRVTVYDVSDVAYETSELAFLTVSRQAVGKALETAGAIELEPVMRLEVSLPQDQVGNMTADLTARRGRVAELDSLAPGRARIVAFVPLAGMFGYASALRSQTGGRVEFTAEPFQYESRREGMKASGKEEKR